MTNDSQRQPETANEWLVCFARKPHALTCRRSTRGRILVASPVSSASSHPNPLKLDGRVLPGFTAVAFLTSSALY